VAWLDKIVKARHTPRASMRCDPKQPDKMSVRAEAAMTLARMAQSGEGVARDPEAAREYYQMAADAGYVPAVATLAQAHQRRAQEGRRHPGAFAARLAAARSRRQPAVAAA
jgi:TPR repeat protein